MKKLLTLALLLAFLPASSLFSQNAAGSGTSKLSELLIKYKWQQIAKQIGNQATDISKQGVSTVFKKDGTFVSYDKNGKEVGTGTWKINEELKTISLKNNGSETTDVLNIFELNDKRLKIGTIATDVEISFVFSSVDSKTN